MVKWCGDVHNLYPGANLLPGANKFAPPRKMVQICTRVQVPGCIFLIVHISKNTHR